MTESLIERYDRVQRLRSCFESCRRNIFSLASFRSVLLAAISRRGMQNKARSHGDENVIARTISRAKNDSGDEGC